MLHADWQFLVGLAEWKGGHEQTMLRLGYAETSAQHLQLGQVEAVALGLLAGDNRPLQHVDWTDPCSFMPVLHWPTCR